MLHKSVRHDEIVKFTMLAPSTVSWYLKKLQNYEIITKLEEGKTTYKLLIEENQIIVLLVSYKESFFDSLVDRVIDMWDLK